MILLKFGLCVDCYCNCSQILKRAESSYRPQRSHICEINLEGRLPDGTIVDKHDHLSIQIGDAEVSVICTGLYDLCLAWRKFHSLKSKRLNITSGVGKLPLSIIFSDGNSERPKVCFIIFSAIFGFFPFLI